MGSVWADRRRLRFRVLTALAVFLALAGVAGFATGRVSGPGSSAALAGLLVGVLGGCALLALIPFAPSVSRRLNDLMVLRPGGALFGSAPPPGALQPPSPEALGPPTGAAVFNAVAMIAIGTGLAAGTGALTGLLGVATRFGPRADRPG